MANEILDVDTLSDLYNFLDVWFKERLAESYDVKIIKKELLSDKVNGVEGLTICLKAYEGGY